MRFSLRTLIAMDFPAGDGIACQRGALHKSMRPYLANLLSKNSFVFATIVASGFAVNAAGAGHELEAVAKHFNIEITFGGLDKPVITEWGEISGAVSHPSTVDKMSTVLAEELSCYDAEIIKRCSLKGIIVCSSLTLNNAEITAATDLEANRVYINAAMALGKRIFLQRLIHHELFHILDKSDDGILSHDDDWSQLNQQGFVYRNDWRAMQLDQKSGQYSGDYPGFLNRYSTCAAQEDKAELFAGLMTHYCYVTSRANEDLVLRRKIQTIKQYLLKFCPTIDEQFWKKAGERY